MKLNKIKFIELPREEQSLLVGGNDAHCQGTWTSCESEPNSKKDKCNGTYSSKTPCDGYDYGTICIGTYKTI